MGNLPLISAGLRLQRNVKYNYDSICGLDLLTSLVSPVMHYCRLWVYSEDAVVPEEERC